MRRVNLLIALGVVLGALAFAPAPRGSPSVADAPSSVELVGWLSIVHGDGEPGSGLAPRLEYRLIDDLGGATQLLLAEPIAEEQIAALRGHRVRVVGTWAATEAAAGAGARPLLAAEITAAGGAEAGAPAESAPEALTGSQPWISVMCKFSDVSAEPKSLFYFNNMYASTKPGLDHYWREVSYDNINVLGSTATGWFTLPHNRAYYLPGGHLDWHLAAQECTALADPAVNFHSFLGINLMFNSDLDGYAWGGGDCLTLDGSSGCWDMTWEPPWGYSSITVISHEMGHGFGLPHSSGDYGATYDNQWDVMSDTWTNCGRSTDSTYGCMGQHTIAYHKDLLAWIPGAQKVIVDPGSAATVSLEQLALPTTSNPQMVKVPIGGSATHFYTVEARNNVALTSGYDVKLPRAGVIIHEVNTTRANRAHVLDVDRNRNTGDAGAQWLPSETYLDLRNRISIAVLSATSSGWVVRVTNQTLWWFLLPTVMR